MRGALPNSFIGSSQIASTGSSQIASPGGHWFGRLATRTAAWTGKPAAFLVAAGLILTWGLTGPLFGFSDTWQLVVNTGTTIVTFLMVFLIQHTQNRDTCALQLKLDELILASKARNDLAAVEDQPEEVIQALKDDIHERAKEPG